MSATSPFAGALRPAIFPAVRVAIVSHAYADPAARGKLRALAGQGVALATAVPARWIPPGSSELVRTPFSEDAGVRLVPVPTAGRSEFGAPTTWRTGVIRRLLTDFRPDLVQIEEEPGSHVAAAVSAMARRLAIPAVLFTRDTLGRRPGLLARTRHRRSLARAAGLIGANAVAAGLVRRERPDLRWTSIPQLGLDVPRAITPEPHPPLALGFVGRLVPERGLDVLLQAAVRLHGPWTLAVAGTGPEQEPLERLAERLGIASRITWMGAIPADELRRLWGRLDCLVAPSRTAAAWVESYPLQVLEAMGHGVAVVVSDSGALPEAVGPAGIVFREGHPEGLAEGLSRLMADPALRERLAAEGRRRVIAEYVDDAVARKTLAFWRSLRDGGAA